MQLLRENQRGFWDRIDEFSRSSSLFDPEIERRTQSIIESVRAEGDRALLSLTERFDGARLTAGDLRVTPAEIRQAASQTGPKVRAALRQIRRNIENFSRRSLRPPWSGRNQEGGWVGEKFDPIQRVGIYIPGGTAPLVSTVLMTVVLAKVARCPEIVVCTPCNREAKINPALLTALRLAGATEVYRLGGAQAVAALAFGTATVRPVQKIFGPGNAYVVAAKRLLFGRVAIDLLPGPSELLVLADRFANARFIASDLLAQAEHGSGHERIWLVSTSAPLVSAVQKEMRRQLVDLPRRPAVEAVLAGNFCLITVGTVETAIAVTNRIAPEHCEIAARSPGKIARRITTAGSIFLGAFSPTVLGDYVAGPSHVLPTGGAGRAFSGLTADQFQRRTSMIAYSKKALARIAPALSAMADVEGLEAHRRSALIRLAK